MSCKRGKNDAADAAAICEAVQRPAMRFVPVKSVDQQSRLMVHRARQGYVQACTATINRIRGLLSEFGIVLAQKAETVRCEAAGTHRALKQDEATSRDLLQPVLASDNLARAWKRVKANR